MTAAEVLAWARAAGIRLTEAAGRLKFEAPAEALSPQLLDELRRHKPAILDLLEAEQDWSRRLVRCGECAHHRPAPRLRRVNGPTWEMPGGCSVGLVQPTAHPPIYPFTGHYCHGWQPADRH